MNDDCKQAERKSQVIEQVGCINDALGHTEDLACRLQDRLKPVMHDEPKTVDEDDKELVCLVPFANELRQLADRIQQVNERLDSGILSRLEL